ncbi:MAG: thioredoxin family protein, partial [Candidatus Thermoplasmatota archaeon]|nr:thioredoxin family protein [Candidatus Thermoplasmatota archaeon]
MTLQTGDAAPDFNLPNANAAVGGDHVSLADAAGANGTLVLFECNHCPYVVASVGRINAMA